MKPAISNIAWHDAEQKRILNDLSGKLSHLEIVPGRAFSYSSSKQAILNQKTKWQDLGFNIVSFQALLFGTTDLGLFGSDQQRKALLHHLKLLIEYAGLLGTQNLVFGVPKNRQLNGLNKNQAIDIANPFFTELGNYAKAHNTVLAIEPCAREYGCDFLSNTSETVEYLVQLNHSHIRLNLDLSTMTLENENYASTLELAAPYINHIHISEPHLAPVPQNIARHTEFAALLRSMSYQGYISIEMKSNDPIDNQSPVKTAVDFLLKTYCQE